MLDERRSGNIDAEYIVGSTWSLRREPMRGVSAVGLSYRSVPVSTLWYLVHI